MQDRMLATELTIALRYAKQHGEPLHIEVTP
jgi:hypothetical protein